MPAPRCSANWPKMSRSIFAPGWSACTTRWVAWLAAGAAQVSKAAAPAPQIAFIPFIALSPSRLVVVARHAHGLGDPLIFLRPLEDRAGVELPDHRALDFLPRRLRRREGIAARRGQRAPPFLELLVGDQHVG